VKATPPLDTQQGEVTEILAQLTAGCPEVWDELVPLVYDRLRGQARSLMRRERRGHSLQTTDLVHEAFLRLAGQQRVQWKSREHFFSVAARTMRLALVDHARRRQAQKRGGTQDRVNLDETAGIEEPDLQVLALDEALDRLAAIQERQARVVEYRCFGGLTVSETAAALGVSIATVGREWRAGRAWLQSALGAN